MIDLHIHTTNSDGRLTVNEILERVKKQNVKAISFCDHNVLGAYKEISKEKIKNDNIEIITGIEFDFVFKHKDFHMLGYNFNWQEMDKSPLINKKTPEEIINIEKKNLRYLKKICKEMKIKIDENLDIKTSNDKASTVLKYKMMEFKENDEILNEMLGKNRERSFARGFVQNPNSPFYIDMTIGLPTAIEVADLIHNTGGEVYLAHPFDYKDIDHEKYIQDIYDLKILDGIECIHTRHNLKQIEFIKEFAKANKLKISGGSDFHRDGKQKIGYGVNGTVEITEEYMLKKV